MNPQTDELLDGKDDFSFYLPDSLCLIEKSDGAGEDSYAIGGYCSTERLDRQDEIVVAKGLDFSEFVQWGWFNDNHKQDTAAAIGYPTGVRLDKSRWWTEGHLIRGFPPADAIWTLAKALQRSGAPRKLGFSIEGKVIERDGYNKILKAKIRNVAVTNVPVNTDCFPGNVRVVGAGEKLSRRWYSGPFVEIVLLTGEKLSGTPNHPVLTDRGWVALGDLDEFRDRVGCCGRDVDSAQTSHDVEYVPTTLEEIFHFAGVVPTDKWVYPSRTENFHGDGVGGDVDVVLIDGELKYRLNASFFQKFGNHPFSASYIAEASLPTQSQISALFRGAFFASEGFVRRSGDRFALLGGGVGHSQASHFARAPQMDVGFFENRCDSFVRDFVASSDGVRGLQGQVGFDDSRADEFVLGRSPIRAQKNTGFLDDGSDSSSGNLGSSFDRNLILSGAVRFSNIVTKRGFNFSEHVYNLQTSLGWYVANGIVAHNCSFSALVKAFASPEAVSLAADKAVSANYSHPAIAGSNVLRPEELEKVQLVREEVLSFSDALDKVKKRWPDLSETACRRVARFVMAR